MFFERGEHAFHVELEIRLERYADETHAAERRDQPEHHERRLDAQYDVAPGRAVAMMSIWMISSEPLPSRMSMPAGTPSAALSALSGALRPDPDSD